MEQLPLRAKEMLQPRLVFKPQRKAMAAATVIFVSLLKGPSPKMAERQEEHKKGLKALG